MQLELNEEQQLLKESVARFVERDYGFEQRGKYLATGAALNRELWKQFAELGWLGVAIPESYGGAGYGYLELAVIAAEIGRALAPVPFGPTVALAAEAVARADVGPIPGEAILLIGGFYIASWTGIALWSFADDRKRARSRGRSQAESMG